MSSSSVILSPNDREFKMFCFGGGASSSAMQDSPLSSRVVRLKQPNAWETWSEASEVANKNGIRFVDSEIQGPDKIWLVPFYEAKAPDKKQFGMLDCGTLTVEFASE